MNIELRNSLLVKLATIRESRFVMDIRKDVEKEGLES
jgi:hypothetical protein